MLSFAHKFIDLKKGDENSLDEIFSRNIFSCRFLAYSSMWVKKFKPIEILTIDFDFNEYEINSTIRINIRFLLGFRRNAKPMAFNSFSFADEQHWIHICKPDKTIAHKGFIIKFRKIKIQILSKLNENTASLYIGRACPTMELQVTQRITAEN